MVLGRATKAGNLATCAGNLTSSLTRLIILGAAGSGAAGRDLRGGSMTTLATGFVSPRPPVANLSSF